MPVLESSDRKIAPRSILRHRPINTDSTPTKKRSTTTTQTAPAIPRASRVRPSSALDENAVDEWRHIPHTEDGEQAYTLAEQPAKTGAVPKTLKRMPRSVAPTGKKHNFRPGRNVHPLFYLGLGMLFMLVLWMAIMGAVGWFTSAVNTIRYGYPRTYQTDQFVGHNESSGVPSHFIALNLHGHLEVIEMPGGDASHARIYEGPQLYTSNADLVPVMLKFEDVNGDHKPDMLLCFQSSQVVYINTQGGFQPLTAAERPQVEQFLQRPGASC
jgi:hypothetical protein